jgi:hypothetical protein
MNRVRAAAKWNRVLLMERKSSICKQKGVAVSRNQNENAMINDELFDSARAFASHQRM